MQNHREEFRGIPSIVGRAPDFDWATAPELPHELFLSWLRCALEAGAPEAHAATLSTVDENNFPDARMLIVRDVTENCGFTFSSSDESPKGLQLLQNPHCALTFYWSSIARAVRVRGVAERASTSKAAEDFLARHPQARAIALAGRQSSVVSDLSDLEELPKRAEAAIAVQDDLVSSHWAMWTVVAQSIEFWQGDPNRNHQRLHYVRTASGWEKQRLWP